MNIFMRYTSSMNKRDWSLRWIEPICLGDTNGPNRTDSIDSIRLGPKSVDLDRSRSGSDRGCPSLTLTRCRAWTMNNLASSYERLSQSKKVTRPHEETLEIRERGLGPEHSDTLSSMNNLASSYERFDQSKEVRRCSRRRWRSWGECWDQSTLTRCRAKH